ncbi:SDR family oxidoreductase [Variovorax sp. J22P271]|uniref:SDR family NAD(P)-dependent oxidoreductase n=1 Tax=Variovorax davisae TaxID=3053515 RepID=UPI002574BDA2|nr:SDR family oxidoreductase [Variovorax sp. J22P271]MDM0035647.1 SDR family oxidoreductase [Variovorax sp. J22P271]
MESRMEGKVALVTGGAQGIGRAICERFAAEGAIVAVLDIKAENAERAAQAIREQGGQAVACAGNVAERATFESAVDMLESAYGRLDVLVNNAIWVRYGPIDAITPEVLDRMVATGFKSVVWGTQVAAGLMAKGRGGSIINIASAAGFLGMPNGFIYCGVKAGVLGLTRASAVELGPKKIRVNAIAPGTIMTEGVSINVDEAGMAKRIARTPVGRLGQVEDIANAAVFLAGDDSGFMTGESMLIDGGVTHAFL